MMQISMKYDYELLDNVMGNCNLAWGGFTPMDNKVAIANTAIRL
jgi:hypothetical protein